MFDNLSDKLSLVFKKVRGHGKLNEKNIQEALREVRMALLEADVNYKVVKEFTGAVKGRANGSEVGLTAPQSRMPFVWWLRVWITSALSG